MDFSKIKKISFILIILFILLFPFWCVRGLCTEIETVNPIILEDTLISSVNHTITENPDFITFAIPLEKNYTYHASFSGVLRILRYSFGNSTDIGTKVENLVDIGSGDEITIDIVANDYDYLFVYFSAQDTSGSQFTYNFTREPTSGMVYSVDNLVSNVGINNIWNIFSSSIDYIVVVVLVAFGIYIIFIIIRKISRGKEGL